VQAAIGGQLDRELACGLEVVTELPLGTTMVTGRPWRRAANAMDWPWLPRVADTSPGQVGSRRMSAST
jgi:hypothetical protein